MKRKIVSKKEKEGQTIFIDNRGHEWEKSGDKFRSVKDKRVVMVNKPETNDFHGE